MKKKDIVKYLLKNIESVSSQWSAELKSHNEESLKYYKAEELDLGEKKKKNVSKYVSATLADAVNWAMPVLMDIFAGTDEIFKGTARTEQQEDVQAARDAEAIVKYQLFTRNKWYIFVYDWIWDCLMYKQGIAKTQWFKETKNIDVIKENIQEQELALLLSQDGVQLLSQEPIINGLTIDALGLPVPNVTGYNATIRYTADDEYSLVEALPFNSCGYDLTTRDIDRLDFFYHKEELKAWEIKKKYGDKVYNRIKKMRSELKENKYDFEHEEFKDLGGYKFIVNSNDEDGDNNKYWKYECFYIDEDTGSHMIANLIGEELLEEPIINKYSRIPVRIITPFRQSHRIAGFSMYNKLKQFQRISTAIMRQLLNNLYYNNEGRYIISRDSKIDLDSWENGSGPGGYVECHGDPNAAVMALLPPPLQPWAFQMLERVTQEIEYQSGVPRSFKGIDVGTLNKTFRGQAQQINQASQIIKSMARLIAEMGFIPMLNDVIDMNIKFLSQKQSFRIANKPFEVSGDNLIGKYDFTVNVGIGVDNKDQTIMRMQQLLGIYAQMKKANVPVVTAQNAYTTLRELVKAMGYQNLDDFATDPKLVESIQALIAAVIVHMQTMGMPIPELMEPLQRLMSIVGMPEPPKNKKDPGGTRPNQEMPRQANQPAQPMQPTLTRDGNEFFG